MESQSDHCLPLSLTQAVSHCVSSFKLIGTILVLHDDMIGQRSYFGKSTQPSGPLCLWQCLRSYLQEMVARVVISGIPLHSIVAMVVRERRGPVPSVGAAHHLNKLNVSRELGFRVTSCLPSILYSDHCVQRAELFVLCVRRHLLNTETRGALPPSQVTVLRPNLGGGPPT